MQMKRLSNSLLSSLKLSQRAVDSFIAEAYQIAIDRVEKQKRIESSPRTQEYNFYGGNAEFVADQTSKEKILSGPAETGKTIACLYYLNQMCWEYPGAQMAIVRATYKSMPGSVLSTFENKILPKNSQVVAFGGKRPERYIYPNGSVIWIGGMDNPDKVLSSERDIIYYNQAEEGDESARNKLLTRVTGRSGVMPFAQLIEDCNPSAPSHHLLRRRDAGYLTFYNSTHKDNPNLYKVVDGKITDEPTEQGKKTIKTLESLTGVDRNRLYLGLWAQATGIIYPELSDSENITSDADYVQGGGEIYWAVDDGYSGAMDNSTGQYTAQSHPRTFGLYQLRKNGDLCLFYEHYAVKTLDDVHISTIEKIVEENGYPQPDYVVVDKSAASLKGRLHANGYYTRNSPSSVEESIKELRRWIAPDENGKRRFFIHPRCKHTRYEYSNYRRDNNGKIIKEHDHGTDRDRYMVWILRHEY